VICAISFSFKRRMPYLDSGALGLARRGDAALFALKRRIETGDNAKNALCEQNSITTAKESSEAPGGLGEQRPSQPGTHFVLFVRIGTGIGASGDSATPPPPPVAIFGIDAVDAAVS
jgi:hypothetical protein